MATLKDFIQALARKAGTDISKDEVKNFIDSLGDMPVPEVIESSMQSALISLTDAKNNHSDIKGHYYGQAMKSVDLLLNRLVSESDNHEELQSLIEGESNTYKKVELLYNGLKDILSKKGKTQGGDLARQIDELQAALRGEKEGSRKQKEEYDGKLLQLRREAALDAIISRIPTIYDDENLNLPPEVKKRTLYALIESALSKDGASFNFDDSDGFILQKKDGTNFYNEQNQLMRPQSFIEKVISDAKILRINQPAGSAGGNNQFSPQGNTFFSPQGNNQPAPQGNTRSKLDAAYAAQRQKALNDLKVNGQATSGTTGF